MKSYLILLAAIVLGVITGLIQWAPLLSIADSIATLFLNFLRLIVAPIVFLSIFSTLLTMRGFEEMRTLGRKVLTYTVLTTIASATIALLLFLLINPVREQAAGVVVQATEGSYLSFLLGIIPANLVVPFVENNVIAIAFLGFLFGLIALKLPAETRTTLSNFFNALFQLTLKTAGLVAKLMPIGIWAFTVQLTKDLQSNTSHMGNLMLYLGVVLAANLIQGFVIIPLILKWKGLSPLRLAKGGFKALVLAFFSKSSNATLPVTLQCCQHNLAINPRVANFSLPLCTVINMNGCAAFILTTVLFVAGIHGHAFGPMDLALWVLLATIAAIGNAGVPMGCFFLASAFLVGMGIPITTMGLILPFYAFLDMVETALNVWSDLSVTAIVDKEVAIPAVAEEVGEN
jgi:Na+/H+-dicarboxylate symporter